MGSQLQQVLRSLCFNSGWTYAVFWKLKHVAKMMFTCEDAYYDHHQYPDKKYVSGSGAVLDGSPYPQDPLALAVAKLSYEVYSLGEGVVGQVAVSGKHSWIYSDMDIFYISSTSEVVGGWKNQFSAGVKTIAFVPVIPHGVVQLGSLHKIAEDLKLVDHVRNVFSELLNSSVGCIPSAVPSCAEYSCLSDMGTRFSDSAGFDEDEMTLSSQLISSFAKSSNYAYASPQPGDITNKIIEMKMHETADYSMLCNEVSLPSSSRTVFSRREHEGMKSHADAEYGEMNVPRNLEKRPQITNMPSVENVTIPTDGSQIAISNLPLENLETPVSKDQCGFRIPEIPNLQLQDLGKNTELQTNSNCIGKQISPFSVRAGYELYEALGASFQEQIDCVWEAEKSSLDMAIDISEAIGSSSLLMDSSDTHLLDAVVAKISQKGVEGNTLRSCQDMGESLLSAERTPCISLDTISSAGYSFDRDTSSSFNSVTCGIESLNGFSSPSSSRGSERLEKGQERVKMNKKRARPGESSRPRPRDRQLIQDRIKELRELVPNGSKCSIDSLLERTIKHMLFSQSITKHAEKLLKCSASKLLDKETGMRRFSSREQGSSWAVELGTNAKVCPIIVENLNMNGQMLVEMLCEEGNRFLDVAETIRSMGLTILKGVSEPYGDKTWMCFVVEGQNNRSMHRMDVLWSLMQLLQPELSGVVSA